MLNNPRTRRIIAISVGIIVIISIAYILYSTRRGAPGPTISRPNIPTYISGQLPIELKIDENHLELPSSLPILEIDQNQPLGNSEAAGIARKMNFSGDPIVSKDVLEGDVYIWINDQDNSNLTIYSKSRKVDYSLGNIPVITNLKLDDATAISSAKNFITKNQLLSENQLGSPFLTYLREDEAHIEEIKTVTKEEADLYQVNFSPSLGKYKILTTRPENSPIFVWVLPDGSIGKANITVTGPIREGASYKLQGFDQISKSLTDARIVSIDNGNAILQDIEAKSFKKITITSIVVNYLWDSINPTFLQPVYLLSGTASITGYANDVNISLYLPAIGSLQP